jgi:hypothetical protein
MLKDEIVIDDLRPRPRWMRIAQVRNVYGLSIVQIYALLNAGQFVSIVLKKEETTRGVRLISVESIERYFAKGASDQFKPMALERGVHSHEPEPEPAQAPTARKRSRAKKGERVK